MLERIENISSNKKLLKRDVQKKLSFKITSDLSKHERWNMMLFCIVFLPGGEYKNKQKGERSTANTIKLFSRTAIKDKKEVNYGEI